MIIRFYKKFKNFIKQLFNMISSSYLGLFAINDTSENDIFIVGYPKSGNTWLQNILVEIAYGFDVSKVDDTLLQELVPDVHFKRYYNRYMKTMFFKSHFLPQPKYRKVVYLIRDGRDVMVSYYYYLYALGHIKSELNTAIIGGHDFFPSSWSSHVKAWFDNPYDAEIIFLKYEDLLKNPFDEIKKVVDFAKLNVNDSMIHQAIERTSFQKMRKKEKKGGWDNKRNWPKDKPFVRKGKSGSYKEEMSDQAIKTFMLQSHEMLKKCGYE